MGTKRKEILNISRLGSISLRLLSGVISGLLVGYFSGIDHLNAASFLLLPGTLFSFALFLSIEGNRDPLDLLKLLFISNIAYLIAIFSPGILGLKVSLGAGVFSWQSNVTAGIIGALLLLAGIIFLMKYDIHNYGWIVVVAAGAILALAFTESFWEGSNYSKYRIVAGFSTWQGGISFLISLMVKKKMKE